MKKNIFRSISFRFGMLFSSVGLGILFFNVVYFYLDNGYVSHINIEFVKLFIVSVIVLISAFFKKGIYVQLICLCLTAIVTLYNKPDQASASFQFIVIFMLLEKLDLLNSYRIKKIVIIISLFFTIMLISIVVHSLPIKKLLPVILFYAFFTLSVFMIMKEELVKYFLSKSVLKSEIESVYIKLKAATESLERIKNDFIDPKKAGLTKAEITVLEKLCLYGETNKELGERLGKSQDTVKRQLSSIMTKVGADSRYHLIELCKNYFEGGVYENK